MQSIHRCPRKEKFMDQESYSRGMTRRGFVVSFGPGMYVLGTAGANAAALQKVPTATGIDALFVPFVVAAELKIFEKYGLETSYKPFDDGNVALDAVLTGNSDIGATTEFGGLSRWDKGGKLYVTSYSSTSGQQIGLAGRDDARAHRSDGLLQHQCGRGGQARRQGVPDSGSRHEGLHEPHELPRRDAQRRGAGQFPGRCRSRARRGHHQEDAGLE